MFAHYMLSINILTLIYSKIKQICYQVTTGYCQFYRYFLPCDAMRCTIFVIVIPSVRLSVRLSVRHTRGLCPHGSTYDHDFFTVW